MTAVRDSLPSAQSSDWCYLLKNSESGIADFLYGTHNDRGENGETYQVHVYFLPFQDSALFSISSVLTFFFFLLS